MLTETPICIIQRGKPKSDRLAKLVIAGCGGGRIFYGDQGNLETFKGETPVIIGAHPSTIDLLWDFHSLEIPFVVMDNGYAKGYKEGGYFRATTNAMQWIGGENGRVLLDEAEGQRRFSSLDMPPIKPLGRSTPNGHILIALQSEGWFEMMGYKRQEWLDSTIAELKKYTKRTILVRDKPRSTMRPDYPLSLHFEDCHAVVAFSSNVMIKASLEGIPVFPMATCAASPLGTCDLSQIENPPTKLRLPTLHALAANQWNEREIESGQMWKALKDRYEHKFYELS